MTWKCLFAFPKAGGRWSLDALTELERESVKVLLNKKGRWLTEEELIEEIKEIDAVLAGSEPYTSKVINSAKKLKIIARVGVGYENVDLEAATEKGIFVTWTPIPELARSVAEEALALMMAVLRYVPRADHHVRSGGFDIEGIAAHVKEAYHLTIGVLGLGRIGTEFAKLARTLSSNVIYYDVIRKEQLEKELGIKYVAFEELLRMSDVISIHVPLTPKTEKLIGEKEISLMKEGAVLINTSRGKIVDEKALYKALVEGKLGGAGISVFSKEPPDESVPFYKLGDRLPNVVLYPHIGVGRHTAQRMLKTAIQDILAALRGGIPKYLLNKEVLEKLRK